MGITTEQKEAYEERKQQVLERERASIKEYISTLESFRHPNGKMDEKTTKMLEMVKSLYDNFFVVSYEDRTQQIEMYWTYIKEITAKMEEKLTKLRSDWRDYKRI